MAIMDTPTKKNVTNVKQLQKQLTAKAKTIGKQMVAEQKKEQKIIKAQRKKLVAREKERLKKERAKEKERIAKLRAQERKVKQQQRTIRTTRVYQHVVLTPRMWSFLKCYPLGIP